MWSRRSHALAVRLHGRWTWPRNIYLAAEQVDADETRRAIEASQTPLQRPAEPDELAPAYVFLASSSHLPPRIFLASGADSSYITGIVLPVLGGETIGG